MSEGSEGLVKGEGFAVDASLVKADVNRQTAVPGNELSSVNWRDPKRCTRAVQEYLDGVDQANPIETVPKSVSLTDPCARWTATEGPAFFSYSLTYLNRIITSEHGGQTSQDWAKWRTCAMDTPPSYRGYRFPGEIIAHCTWLYFRFSLSFRDVQEMMLERGVEVSSEAIRPWTLKFGSAYARHLRHRRSRCGDTWHLDEVFLKINGEQVYRWRAVDQDGEVLDILVQKRRNAKAAKRFFRTLLKHLQYVPRTIVTDKLASYGAAHAEVMPLVTHQRGRCFKQSSVELASTDARKRTANATIQIDASRAAISLGARHGGEPFSGGSTPDNGVQLPSDDATAVCNLETSHPRFCPVSIRQTVATHDNMQMH